MIDLDEEQARMESMLDRRERMALGVTCTEMIELITRLRQAEKDAARYRWLDEQNKSLMSKVMVCNGWIDDGDDIDYVSDIASFIDEAMQCK